MKLRHTVFCGKSGWRVGMPLLPITALLSACAASTSPGYDAVFGDATRTLQVQQRIDPAAPQHNAGLVTRADGRTIREGVDRQVETFKAPPQPTVINIGVGTR